jgi:hypothetical protein
MSVIGDEETKEQERAQLLEMAKSRDDKQKMEYVFGLERARARERIEQLMNSHQDNLGRLMKRSETGGGERSTHSPSVIKNNYL